MGSTLVQPTPRDLKDERTLHRHLDELRRVVNSLTNLGVILPSGGTTGQVLGKDSATDYDVSWQDVSAGGEPGGSDTQLQYNDNGSFNGMDATWDGTTLALTGNQTISGTLITTGASTAATYNGVALTTAGAATNYLGEDGNYTVPSGTPGGSDTNVQYNNSGAFAGESAFTWDSTNDTLTITGAADAEHLIVTGHSTQGDPLALFQNNGATTSIGFMEDGRIQMDGGDVVRITDTQTGALNAIIIGENNASGVASPGNYNYLIGHDIATGASFTGVNNVAMGWQNLKSCTTGNRNVALGLRCGEDITTGYENVFLGNSSGRDCSTGYYNFGMGTNSLLLIAGGHSNVAIGWNTLANLDGGRNCVAIGLQAGQAAEGNTNTFIGAVSGGSAGSGQNNVGIGGNSLRNIGNSSYNVGVGQSAGQSNVDNYNTHVGYFTGRASSGAAGQAGYGAYALEKATGNYMTAVGYEAGEDALGATGCVYLGYRAGQGDTTSDRLIIGNTSSSKLIWGDFANEWLVFNGYTAVTGNQDAVQLTVTGHSTQTNDLFVVEDSSNVDIFQVSSTKMQMTGSAEIGDGGTTNYVEVEADGEIVFHGESRIKWTKITADSVTLSTGSTSEVVADLQTANDGNVYAVQEAGATPGQNLIIDFVSVTAFNWVNILMTYDGSATHSLSIQLYNWGTTSWDHFSAVETGFSNSGTVFDNNDFIVPDDTNYIGTGGDAGKVRVRIIHPMTGNASHYGYIDVVALYQ